MSRIGRAPVYFDKTVKVQVDKENLVTVKGAKTSITIKLRANLEAKVDEGKIILMRSKEDSASRAYHGLFRALIQNAVTGVTKGWTRELELNGVGYRANVAGKNLELTLGYSHPVVFKVPEGIEVKVEKQTKIQVSGADRDLVGKTAAKIRSFRPPEPYLGKGIKYADEVIRRKAGKSAAK